MNENDSLKENSVFVWICDTKDADEDIILKEYGNFLSKKRLDSIKRCKNSRARILSVCAGALLHEVLSKYGVREDDLDYGKNGKPFVKGREDVCFNLSHSGRYVMLAVSGGEVGADIQKDVPDSGALIRKISKVGMPADERLCFVWALKESYTKLLGVGILKDFSDITFCRTDEFIEVYDNEKRVAFAREIPAGDDYSAVICMERPFEIAGLSYLALTGRRSDLWIR